MIKSSTCSALTIAVCSGCVAIPAFAQSDSLMLEEVIVSARKRDESLQDVPLAVTAFTAADIEDAGIDNAEDVALYTPGFTFAKLLGQGSSTPVIRGMSTTIGEPNVGFFVDGVYQSSRSIMDAMLNGNIARVEVAKGPQNALYGRNTFAGAINFVTREPTEETTGLLQATVGNGGHKAIRANLSGPLLASSAFYQVGALHAKTDGFFTNELTGADLDTLESTIFTGALLLYPNDHSKIVARVGYDRTRDGDYAQRFLVNNLSLRNPLPAPLPPALQGYEGEFPSFEDGFAVTPGHNHHDNLTLSVTAQLDLNRFSITSISGYNDLDIDIATDNDYEARSIRYLTRESDQQEFSQELRISSDADSAYRWVVGAYYYRLETDSHSVDTFVDEALGLSSTLQGSPLAALLPPGVDNITDEKTESFSLFGSFDMDITDRISATLEGRWTMEEKRVVATDTNPLTMASSVFDQDADFDNFVPRFTVNFQLNDASMIYGSVAKAVKTGGFNVNTSAGAIMDDERTYSPEKSWNYELGIKNTLADGRVNLNIAAFYTSWDDQIVRALGKNFSVLNANAGESSVQGVEVEVKAQMIEGFDISAGLAYIDSAYDKYTFGALANLGFDPVLDGVRLQYVSKYQGHVSAQYLAMLTNNLTWKTRLDISYQSDQSVVQNAMAYIGDTTLVNFRTGVETEHWDVSLWVKNLLEEDSAVGGVVVTNYATRYDTAHSLINPNIAARGFQAFNGLSWSRKPREWGLTARYKF